MYIEYCYGPKWLYLIYIAYIGLFGTGICRFVQVLYLGRAPRTKETLPDFREKCRVTRHLRVFRGLTGSQRTPGFWGVTHPIPRDYVSRGLTFGLSQRITASTFSRSTDTPGADTMYPKISPLNKLKLALTELSVQLMVS